ncbi:MAG TPA: FAD-dependent oxidoreductase, partial [Burkholderiaceae bacterium]|nr:FAD-dependent oxidoreductase [Burkholderiaceae bacterium]
MRVGIAGAGVVGRLLAWRLAREGHEVEVFDPALGAQAPATGQTTPSAAPYAAGFTAAGMLSPLAELDQAEPEIARLGWRSLALWQAIGEALADHAATRLVRRDASLLVAHGSDLGAARRVLARLQGMPDIAAPEPLDRDALRALEPALAPQLHAWRLPGEGQLLPREILVALHAAAPTVRWQWGQPIARVEPGRLVLQGGAMQGCDLAIDARGLGAREALPQLRGVRGEVVWLHAPGVPLARPVRLLHARHRVYLVPRPGDLVVVGASEIESEDRSPVSLRSAVELMAAAHSVIPELAEARIVHMEANLRPALPDHRPLVHHEPGLLRINGLFRHGWLLAPA